MRGEITDGDRPNRARWSRRELMAGAAGGAGVVAAQAMLSAAPAQATQGSPVLLGTDNTGATARTGVLTASSASALLADPGTGIGVAGTGAAGAAGVDGTGGASNGIGVVGHGVPADGVGVAGHGGGTGTGVVGFGGPSNGLGMLGEGVGFGDGVQGFGGSGGGSGVQGTGGFNGVGVVGIGQQAGDGVQGVGGSEGGTGVSGSGSASGNGTGVLGTGGGTGDGVHGISDGNAVHGTALAGGGVGVLAENTEGGIALQAKGQVSFSRSGMLVVPAGKFQATKRGVVLTDASMVLATLQFSAPGLWLKAAVPDSVKSSFTVHLNQAAPVDVRVAWFIVN